jgi:hypothetical protein
MKLISDQNNKNRKIFICHPRQDEMANNKSLATIPLKKEKSSVNLLKLSLYEKRALTLLGTGGTHEMVKKTNLT